jgi:hypothetical protein
VTFLPTKEEGNENLRFSISRNISKYVVLSLILYGNIDHAFELLEQDRKRKK